MVLLTAVCGGYEYASEQQGLKDIGLTLVLCEQSSPMLAWFISVML